MNLKIFVFLIFGAASIGGTIHIMTYQYVIYIDNYCKGEWKDDNNVTILNLLFTSNSSTSYYTCNEADYFLILAEKELTVSYLPIPSFKSRNSTVSCIVSLYGSDKYHLEAEVTMYDESNNYGKSRAILTYGKHLFNFTEHFAIEEHKYIECSLEVVLTSTVLNETFFEIKNLTVFANTPPKNTRPDRLLVPVNEQVVCLTDSYPPAHRYQWICDYAQWRANGSTLTFYDETYIKCNCTVYNKIGTKTYKDSWTGIIRTRASSRGEIILQRHNSLLYLNNLERPCPLWLIDNNTEISVAHTIIDCLVVSCSNDKSLSFLIVPVRSEFTFSYSPKPPYIGHNVSLSCSISFKTNNKYNMYSKLYIYNSSNYEFNFTYEFHSLLDNDSYASGIIAYHEVKPKVSRTFFCKWLISANSPEFATERFLIKNLTVRPNMSPRNVRVDKKLAIVNKTHVKCIGDAEPPITLYIWICTGEGWITDNDRIMFTEIGVYDCECAAEHLVEGIAAQSTWAGRITAKRSNCNFSELNILHCLLLSLIVTCSKISITYLVN